MVENIAVYSESTDASGSANAAELDLEQSNGEFDIHYNFGASGDLEIEVSDDGTTWWSYRTVSESGSAEDFVQDSVMFAHVRCWATSIADADVNDITISTRI